LAGSPRFEDSARNSWLPAAEIVPVKSIRRSTNDALGGSRFSRSSPALLWARSSHRRPLQHLEVEVLLVADVVISKYACLGPALAADAGGSTARRSSPVLFNWLLCCRLEDADSHALVRAAISISFRFGLDIALAKSLRSILLRLILCRTLRAVWNEPWLHSGCPPRAAQQRRNAQVRCDHHHTAVPACGVARGLRRRRQYSYSVQAARASASMSRRRHHCIRNPVLAFHRSFFPHVRC